MGIVLHNRFLGDELLKWASKRLRRRILNQQTSWDETSYFAFVAERDGGLCSILKPEQVFGKGPWGRDDTIEAAK